jgi:hypothetical protein
MPCQSAQENPQNPQEQSRTMSKSLVGLKSVSAAKSRAQRWGRTSALLSLLCLPRVRPIPAPSGRSSGLCARGSTAIRLHAWQSSFIPDGEGTSTPSPQSGQRSPGLAVVDSACWLMPGKLSQPGPAGNERPPSDSPPFGGHGASHRKASILTCAWRCRPESNRRGIDGIEQGRIYFLRTFAIVEGRHSAIPNR